MRWHQKSALLPAECSVRPAPFYNEGPSRGKITHLLAAVGTPSSLKGRFATYEIHLTASDQLDALVQHLQQNGFANACPSLDTATRISVPGVTDVDLGRMLDALIKAQDELDLHEMTIHE